MKKVNKKKKDRETPNFKRAILQTLAGAGILAAALVAPGVFAAIGQYERYKRHHQYYIKTALGRLIKNGLVTFVEKDGRKFLRLTERGKQRFLKYQLGDLRIKRPKKWDGKWRVIIFDISEDRRWVRDTLRDELVNLGFVRLQNSVWVMPWDCEEVTILLKSHMKVGRDVLYMQVDRIENDKWLKNEFDL